MATKIEDKKADTAAPAAIAPAPPPLPPKKEEWLSWTKWYSAHSPVYYKELVERWGSEAKLWDAYADAKMEREEMAYFESSNVWNSAKAFVRVVLPRLKAMDARIDQLQELLLNTPTPPAGTDANAKR